MQLCLSSAGENQCSSIFTTRRYGGLQPPTSSSCRGLVACGHLERPLGPSFASDAKDDSNDSLATWTCNTLVQNSDLTLVWVIGSNVKNMTEEEEGTSSGLEFWLYESKYPSHMYLNSQSQQQSQIHTKPQDLIQHRTSPRESRWDTKPPHIEEILNKHNTPGFNSGPDWLIEDLELIMEE